MRLSTQTDMAERGMKVEINLESSQQFMPDQTNTMDSAEEPVLDRVKDDMASRRVSSHIPAPLRKKKNDEMYKRFITPTATSNPMNYLKQHMRSKSLSDLVSEQKEEEHHRAEINERYGEMDQLKTLLKEEEETWKSNLQSWKSRRRSVTEDARKRKEARDSLEKETEVKSSRRKSKTYREIVEEKMKRDKELAQLQDHDEYEFVSPRSSTSGTATGPSTPWSSFESPRSKSKSAERKESDKRTRTYSDHLSESSRNSPRLTDVTLTTSLSPDTQIAIQPIKYTTKVTAIINHVPTNSESSDTVVSSDLNQDVSPNTSMSKSTLEHKVRKKDAESVVTTKAAFTTSGSYTLPRDFTPTSRLTKTVSRSEERAKPEKTSDVSAHINQHPLQNKKSTIPSVVLRAKYPNASNKPRPKSAYDIGSDEKPSWSSTLPKNYRDYSTPKPFKPVSNSNFSKIRREAFANRRSMFENLSKTEPADDGYAEPATVNKPPPQKTTIPEAPFAGKQSNQESVKPSFLRNQQIKAPISKSNQPKPAKVPLVTPTASLSVSRYGNNAQLKPSNRYPPKVPLVSAASVPSSFSRSIAQPSVEKPQAPTATLTSSGLSLSSPRAHKLEPTATIERNALFDDMKICINQRPRSEKGFGFTVRGGNDGKPVIVDTVSPGGAADVCQLCVSDEILAINDVPLADCKTQDDIVHLIVSSVITGNLSLNIRRYGRSKKASPLRLSGTKVVMTPGGFVQIRSDKQGLKSTSHTSKFSKGTKDANNNEALEEDLPPPPTQQELDFHNETVKSPVHTTHARPATSPLTNLISAASNNPTYIYNQDSSESEIEETSNDSSIDALSEVHTNRGNDNEEDLQSEVLQAQKALEFEEAYVHHDQQRKKEVENLRMKLEEEQRMLEQEEAQRDAIRRKILEESRMEDMRVEEELRRLNARKQEKMQRRMEHERLQGRDKPTSTGPQQRPSRTNGLGKESAVPHWMIEEAERRRRAEVEGRPRMAAQEYGRKMQDSHSSGPLPDHVIQRLTERTAKNRIYGHGSHMQDSYNTWNDPNPQATLL